MKKIKKYSQGVAKQDLKPGTLYQAATYKRRYTDREDAATAKIVLGTVAFTIFVIWCLFG